MIKYATAETLNVKETNANTKRMYSIESNKNGDFDQLRTSKALGKNSKLLLHTATSHVTAERTVFH